MNIRFGILRIENNRVQAHAAGAGLPLRARAVAAESCELLPGLSAIGGAKQCGIFYSGIDLSGSVSEGSRCQTRLNSQGCCVPSYHWWW